MTVYNPHEIEKQMAAKWKRERAYEKTKQAFAKEKPFFFMDGPPYATASIHLGTAWNKIIKDTYIRFWRMQGFNTWDQPGYDTHGTPIEVQVEKSLSFSSKKDIEEYGAARFIKKCREYATKYIDVMSRQFADLGVWMDWKRPYLTLHNHYIEGAWFTFKQAFQNGHLYKGSYPVHVCTRCETVVAYNEIEHQNVSEKSVYVKFPVKDKYLEKGEEKGKTFLVIWTTTPWTLPANTGVMVHPDFDYAYVKVTATGETLIVAKELAQTFMTEVMETGNFKIIRTVKGKQLDGMEYEHPLADLVPALQGLKKAHRVVLSSRFVNLDAGTGLVHTAPGHGAEDWQVGREKGLPVISPVNLDGTFTQEAGSWLECKYTKDMDSVIIQKLSERGVLVGTEESSHEYPHCWRCDTPLLFLNVPQWFFKVRDIRQKLLNENKKVNWAPKWAGQRFNDWLENLDDWPISRQRYWGIPLPIWECTGKKDGLMKTGKPVNAAEGGDDGCGNIEVIGSFEELKKKGKLLTEIDFHRPAIDAVKWKCAKCRKEMRRVPDVLDVWFDSGVSTWASLEYPRKKDLFNKMWPSQFQLEGPDQFRGWWNSEMITSYLTFKRAPFKNILLHGFVLDAKGMKMSKSRGNVVTPEEVVKRYGRDVFRFYLMSSPLWNDFYFNWENVKETGRMFNVLWNTYLFVKTYGGKPTKTAPDIAGLKKEDKWIISRINSLTELGRERGKAYHIHEFARQAYEFILNDFSRWYIKIIRDRTSPWYEGEDKAAAQYAMHYVLERIMKLLVPITPFISDKIWTDLYGRHTINLERWPETDSKAIDRRLEKNMEAAKLIFEATTAKRQERGIKLRWPLESLTVSGDTATTVAAKSLKDILCGMLNVKDIKTSASKSGKLSITLGKVLKDEALVRELIRKTQSFRKQAGLHVQDQIALMLETDNKTQHLLQKHELYLRSGTGSKSLEFSKVNKEKGELVHDNVKIKINFRKA
jgi:isoleucyl-tRNA synthetase